VVLRAVLNKRGGLKKSAKRKKGIYRASGSLLQGLIYIVTFNKNGLVLHLKVVVGKTVVKEDKTV